MYEETRPFGVVKDNMIAEVESYIEELYNRSISYIDNDAIPSGAFRNLKWGETLPDVPERTYEGAMKKRDLARAIVWKCVGIEAERMPSQNQPLDIGPNGQLLKQRIVVVYEMIKDQVEEMIDQTDFGFLEYMQVDEIKQELVKAYQEQDIAAIVFYICAYSIHMQTKMIAGVDE